MLIERDLAVALRDGVDVYVDLFRPLDGRPAAPLIGWSPYGKHIPGQLGTLYPNSGVKPEHTPPYTAFEAPDPAHWVPRGYAVVNIDIRGTWHSRGTATYLSPEEAHDYYDLIAWAGTRPWSNGKVGLSGVSYLTSSQWRVTELAPPHLAASWFWPSRWARWGAGSTRVEDLETETREHPSFDAFRASKAAARPVRGRGPIAPSSRSPSPSPPN